MNHYRGQAPVRKVNYHCIVYVSEATGSLDEVALLRLLQQARAEHQKAQLTGLLLYSEGRFLQVVEGPEAPVREFFARIEIDPRHCKLQKLADGPKAQPDFPTWRMSFACATGSQVSELPHYLNPHHLPAFVEPTSVKHLLHEFLAECQVPLH